MLEHPFQKELSSLPPQPKSTGLKLRLCLWLVSALVLLGISPTKENHCVHPSPSGSLALSHTGTQSKDLRPSFSVLSSDICLLQGTERVMPESYGRRTWWPQGLSRVKQ